MSHSVQPSRFPGRWVVVDEYGRVVRSFQDESTAKQSARGMDRLATGRNGCQPRRYCWPKEEAG